MTTGGQSAKVSGKLGQRETVTLESPWTMGAEITVAGCNLTEIEVPVWPEIIRKNQKSELLSKILTL